MANVPFDGHDRGADGAAAEAAASPSCRHSSWRSRPRGACGCGRPRRRRAAARWSGIRSAARPTGSRRRDCPPGRSRSPQRSTVAPLTMVDPARSAADAGGHANLRRGASRQRPDVAGDRPAGVATALRRGGGAHGEPVGDRVDDADGGRLARTVVGRADRVGHLAARGHGGRRDGLGQVQVGRLGDLQVRGVLVAGRDPLGRLEGGVGGLGGDARGVADRLAGQRRIDPDLDLPSRRSWLRSPGRRAGR